MDQPYLEIKSAGATAVKTVPLGDEPVTVGRQTGNTLVLADHMASRKHCVIEFVEGMLQVKDLGSSNGTRVNGQTISTAPLNHGDVVTIGKTEMLVVMPRVLAAAEAQKARPAPARKVIVEEDDGQDPWGEYDLTAPPADEEEEVEVGIPDDPVATLTKIANSIPDKPFPDFAITIVNARAQISFPPEAPGKAAGRSDAPKIFRMLLLICFRKKASDIHIEPKADDFLLRVRADGSMVDLVRLTKDAGTRLTAMIKVLCDVDISQRNKVQEGHFSARAPGRGGVDRRVDYRCSFAPSVYGQKLVMRILDTSNAPQDVDDLGMPAWMQEEITKAAQADSGMILAAGPTGSGKTTSLYTMLRSIDSSDRNITTIEDPIEIQLDGITQLPVDESKGNGFAALLKTVLRQDPDVILIGEIRDPETAKIAMQGAITGHLVLSTVHTKDSVGTIFRLMDLGVEPYMVAQGLHLVLAQRLVRQLCPRCKLPVKPTPEQLSVLEKIGHVEKMPQKLFVHKGCAECLKTGYAGRRGVFELMTISPELREVILKPNPSMMEMTKTLQGTRFSSLAVSGYELVAQGLVEFEEIERVVGK